MSDNISMSEDRLRAILAEFKLDLIERLTRELSRKADLAHVDALEKQIDTLEQRIDSIQGWKNRVLGALALVSAVAIPAALIVFTKLLQTG